MTEVKTIEIKKYLFQDLSKNELSSLCILYNMIRKKTATWLDKETVPLENFIDMIDVETIYIAYKNEKMIGFLTLYVPDQFIHLFFVDADSQGSGIGSQLLKVVETDIAEGTISLKCLMYNETAIKFYQKKGFLITETHEETPETGYHVMMKSI
ncbi:MAG: GNAT family N-acetyltransferase [Vagococcus sp.]|uniref:GNAT family N-acetyltransferase n=1 Tax=Vagococcus sp. TaxID=1933889 RepID=UPI002FC6393E